MIRMTLDLSPLGHALRELDDNLDRAMAEAMLDAGNMVAAEARATHGFTDRTGALSRSIHAESSGGSFLDGTLDVAVVADTPYAKFVEEGTRAHVIEPRRAKALRWIGRNGRAVFARRVRHPGTKPYLFLVGALERLFPTLVTQQAEQGLVRAFKRSGFEVT